MDVGGKLRNKKNGIIDLIEMLETAKRKMYMPVNQIVGRKNCR